MDENWPNDSKLEIIQYPNDILVTPCPAYDFATFTYDLQAAVKIGKLVLETKTCMGLAANQVGISRRFFVMVDSITSKSNGNLTYCFNPSIISHRSKVCWMREGCLSLAGIQSNVPRWEIIDVQYWNERCELKKATLRKYEARIFQHELDHLNGLLIINTEAHNELAG